MDKWIIAIVLIAVAVMVFGCDGTGVMGSPTVVIKADHGSSVSITKGTITVKDGGFNVDPASFRKQEATTQPAAAEKN